MGEIGRATMNKGVKCMKLFLLLGLSLLSVKATCWEKGKVNANGDLIIVEIINRESCNKRIKNETVIVDSPWSILLIYPNANESMYYIFDNKKNRIFKTNKFDSFIDELKVIPNNTNIRNIEKCTVPFAFDLPQQYTDKLKEIMELKQCMLQDKIMYCYCCAEKIDFAF